MIRKILPPANILKFARNSYQQKLSVALKYYTTSNPKTVLVCLDGSEDGHRALRRSMEYSKPEYKFILLTVRPSFTNLMEWEGLANTF